MCYAYPGPRCSADGRAKLQKATAALAEDASNQNRNKFLHARNIYDATPEGKAILINELDANPSSKELRERLIQAETTTRAQWQAISNPMARGRSYPFTKEDFHKAIRELEEAPHEEKEKKLDALKRAARIHAMTKQGIQDVADRGRAAEKAGGEKVATALAGAIQGGTLASKRLRAHHLAGIGGDSKLRALSIAEVKSGMLTGSKYRLTHLYYNLPGQYADMEVQAQRKDSMTSKNSKGEIVKMSWKDRHAFQDSKGNVILTSKEGVPFLAFTNIRDPEE